MTPRDINWIRADERDEKPKTGVAMDDFQLQTTDRLARIETLLEALKGDPPTSEGTKKRLHELEDWQDGVNRKIAYVGGVIVVLGVAVAYVVDWLKANLRFGTDN